MIKLINKLFTKNTPSEDIFNLIHANKVDIEVIEDSLTRLNTDRYNKCTELKERINKAQTLLDEYKEMIE